MMNKPFKLVLLAAWATAWFACQGHSQGTLAPLNLYITGSGSVTPLQDGQLLNVGQSYDMTAIPDAGFTFDSWQPVFVTTVTLTNYNASGDPILPPITSSSDAPEASYIYTSTLTFTTQPVNVISSSTNLSITQTQGWQANFVAVPEPSSFSLFGAGLAPLVVVLYRRFQRGRGAEKLTMPLNTEPGRK